MTSRLSRRKISQYISNRLVDGCDKTDLVNRLAAFLVENHRTKELELVVKDIESELMNRGIVVARLTSAFDLLSDTKDVIANMIKRETGADNVQLSEFIDKKVLGGIKLEIPGMQYDNTIARKLLILKTSNKE